MPAPRNELSKFAPRIITLQISPEKIGDLIGPKGKTIRGIQDETGAELTVDDSGLVTIAAVGDGLTGAPWWRNPRRLPGALARPVQHPQERGESERAQLDQRVEIAVVDVVGNRGILVHAPARGDRRSEP